MLSFCTMMQKLQSSCQNKVYRACHHFCSSAPHMLCLCLTSLAGITSWTLPHVLLLAFMPVCASSFRNPSKCRFCSPLPRCLLSRASGSFPVASNPQLLSTLTFVLLYVCVILDLLTMGTFIATVSVPLLCHGHFLSITH